MMKAVFGVEISDPKIKKKVLGAVSSFLGIVSITMDTEKNNITVIGTADPVKIVQKVRKIWPSASIISAEKEEPKTIKPNQEPEPSIGQIDHWVYTPFQFYPTTYYYYPCNPNAFF